MGKYLQKQSRMFVAENFNKLLNHTMPVSLAITIDVDLVWHVHHTCYFECVRLPGIKID